MKKLVSIILLLVMILCFVGCSDNAEPISTASLSNNVQSSNSSMQTQTQEIELTTTNINDYIIFSTRCSDIEIESAGYKDYDMGEGKITVSTSAKKNVEFSDVIITVLLTPSSSSAWNPKSIQLEIPYNGISENTQAIYSKIASYVSLSPTYSVSVTNVTGTVIANR